MRLLPTGRIELSTSLSSAELVAALRKALCQGPLPTGWKEAAVLAAEISAERVRLIALPRADDRAFFVTGQFSSRHEFKGRIVRRAGGSMLRGALQVRPGWRRQEAAMILGPVAVLGALAALIVLYAMLGPGHHPWGKAPGHALSELIDEAFMPAALLLGIGFIPRLMAQAALERERRVQERILVGAISAAESASSSRKE